jgi:toxin ParE1/3/4
VNHYRLSRLARSDIVDILVWSTRHFGVAARDRYRALLAAAIADVAADPSRPGSRLRPDIGPGIRSWHLRASRDRSGLSRVNAPRHLLIYRVDDGIVVIGRVLHDAMDVPDHVAHEHFDQ